VIVNRSFAAEVLRGGEAVGRRIRYRTDGDSVRPWLDIVGVVEDFPAGFRNPGETSARVYHLATPGELRGAMAQLTSQLPEFAPVAYTRGFLDRYGFRGAFMFCLDEPDREPAFTAPNDRTLAHAERSEGRLVPFVRLDLTAEPLEDTVVATFERALGLR